MGRASPGALARFTKTVAACDAPIINFTELPYSDQQPPPKFIEKSTLVEAATASLGVESQLKFRLALFDSDNRDGASPAITLALDPTVDSQSAPQPDRIVFMSDADCRNFKSGTYLPVRLLQLIGVSVDSQSNLSLAGLSH